MMTTEKPTMSNRWPVLRVRAGSTVQVTLLSGDWVRLVTHFYRRTLLCPETEQCAMCFLSASRPYWYLPVVAEATGAFSIWELSSRTAADLEMASKFVGSSVRPGLRVEASRRTAKSSVRVELLGQKPNPSLARFEQWCSALMAVFGLPAVKAGETIDAYGERVAVAVVARSALMADAYKASMGRRLQSRP